VACVCERRENHLDEEEPGESWAIAASVATHVAQREGGELGEAGAVFAVGGWVQPVVREERAGEGIVIGALDVLRVPLPSNVKWVLAAEEPLTFGRLPSRADNRLIQICGRRHIWRILSAFATIELPILKQDPESQSQKDLCSEGAKAFHILA
jgi:hypothetical protein